MPQVIHSRHMIGSRTAGGAQRFYLRLVHGLRARRQPVVAVTRPASAVAAGVDAEVLQVRVGMDNGYDRWSPRRIRRLLVPIEPDIVPTDMGRATRPTRPPPGRRPVHVARLGNDHKLRGYHGHARAWVADTQGSRDGLFAARAAEPFGNILLEAWAHEKPLVTTRRRRAVEVSHPSSFTLAFSTMSTMSPEVKCVR